MKTTYFHGGTKEEIYIKPPEDVVKHEEKHRVWKLQKSMYRLFMFYSAK